MREIVSFVIGFVACYYFYLNDNARFAQKHAEEGHLIITDIATPKYLERDYEAGIAETCRQIKMETGNDICAIIKWYNI